jgi:hypothetical protein
LVPGKLFVVVVFMGLVVVGGGGAVVVGSFLATAEVRRVSTILSFLLSRGLIIS